MPASAWLNGIQERAYIDHRQLGLRGGPVLAREYLADILPRLIGRIRLADLPALIPARWAAERAAAAAAVAQG